MLEGRRVLVTGATGQVARTLALRLAARNEVFAAARFRDPAAKRALEDAGIATATFFLGEEDLTALPDVDVVLHCAANTNPETTEIAIRENAEGTGWLMRRYRRAEAFFHMSSSSVYRAVERDAPPLREADTLGGVSSYSPHYAMSKLASEVVARDQARALSLPTLIARLDVAYGAHGHGGLPMILFEMMKGGARYRRAAAGESFCSMIHEDDIAEKIEALVAHAAVPARIVNLGGDEPVSIEAVIQHLEALTGLTMEIELGEQASWDPKRLDASLRRKLVGDCSVSWRDGVRRALVARDPEALVG